MRLSITKKHHQQLLLELAASLRSGDPKDALEHVLNCWINPCLQLSQDTALNKASSFAQSEESDISSLVSWD